MAKNLLEVIDELDARLTEQEKAHLRTTKERELIALHFGLGLWIRNQ
ncbi:hypothetical protein OOT46_03520 [Aquabacterium sp. A7-Y]|nr:DUF6794 domain-containing protein [Aquabacterium sp. A7-Y]MCW7536921.1 hypothetical protein [Aquabacterium sp. A7-Y]